VLGAATAGEVTDSGLNQQVRYVQSMVSMHFDENEGQLGVWGSIQRYLFNYAEGVQLVIYPDGSVQQEIKAVIEPRAELQCSGGSPVFFVLENYFCNV
jgi:hypothetical protein